MLRQVLLLAIVGLTIYIFMNPKVAKKIPILSSVLSDKETEKFDYNINIEKKEENELLISSPTINMKEAMDVIKFKNSLVNPYTQTQSNPSMNSYIVLSDLDLKNIQSFIVNLLHNTVIDGNVFAIKPTSITPNLYYAINTNVIHLTPIEIDGKLFINNKEFGDITLMILLKGTTNNMYVPQSGFFVNGIKYKSYVENIKIIKINKNNTPPQKPKGFYGTVDMINQKVEEPKDINMINFTELEDSEEDDINLSEIINDDMIEPDSENATSTIDIAY